MLKLLLRVFYSSKANAALSWFFIFCSLLFIFNLALALYSQFVLTAIERLNGIKAGCMFNQFWYFEVLELFFYYTCSVVILSEWLQKLQRWPINRTWLFCCFPNGIISISCLSFSGLMLLGLFAPMTYTGQHKDKWESDNDTNLSGIIKFLNALGRWDLKQCCPASSSHNLLLLLRFFKRQRPSEPSTNGMLHLWPNDVNAVPHVHCQAAGDVKTTRCTYYSDRHEAPMTLGHVPLLCCRRILFKVEVHSAPSVILRANVTVTSFDLMDKSYYNIVISC